MALINKIREKSGWAIGFIAIGLGLFIVGSDLLGPGGTNGVFGNDEKIGEIAGEKITLQEFQAELQQTQANYAMQTGRNPSEAEMGGMRDQAWNQLIFRTAYQEQFNKLGLAVTDDELEDMVQGSHVHPVIKQTFVNPTTKEFDKALVIRYLQSLRSDSISPQQRAAWETFEQQLGPERLRSKYENLLKNTAYVTKAEAKREYEAQTAKANASVLYVPFYSVPDSTVKVTDEQLQTYLNEHKEEYKGEDFRRIEYVAFSILPSKQDSADLYNEIKEDTKGLATAPNDSAYAAARTDVPFPGTYRPIGELPQEVQDNIATFIEGGMYGPYREGDTYSIYKLADIKDDTTFSTRASHILFRADSAAGGDAEALRKAREVLAQIKAGASFEEMARVHGTDGTAQSGGDLGWFTRGRMVKAFEDAVFNFNGIGLLNQPVKTDFGYHIIKVTQPKTNRLYKLYAIKKSISASDATRDEAYRKASAFLSNSDNLEGFRAALKKDPTLSANIAERVRPNDNFVNTLNDARGIVRWAFNDDTDVNTVAKEIFELENQYVVAAVTGGGEKDKPSIEAFRNELTTKVRNQLKSEQIMKKLGTNVTGPLDAAAQKYGAQAQVMPVTDATLATNSLQNIGYDPTAVGRIFGIKQGARSKPFAGENGVLVIEVTGLTPAPEIADYSQYRNQLQQNNGSRATYFLAQAIQEDADIEDYRYKFY
jgi:peptidyl-prolyl cis-trans isomerase D